MFPLTCSEVLPRLDDLALGLLEPRQEEQVRVHLNQCFSCRQHLDASLALITDLTDALAVSGPLPEGLGDGLTDRLLLQLPDLPGREDPLAGTILARTRAWWQAGVLGGLSLAAGAGLWLTLLLLLPESAAEALRLSAVTLGRMLLNTSAGLTDAAVLILQGFGLVLRNLNPWTLAGIAFGLVAVELVAASRSRHTRWDS